MVNIKIHNWNLILNNESILDNTCGYHALLNGNFMINMLLDNNIKIDQYYINNIRKIFYKNYNLDNFNNQMSKLMTFIDRPSLSKNDLEYLINKGKLSNNIFIYVNGIYNNELNEIIMQKNYKICIIFFRDYLCFFKHWIPIVIDKQENDIYIHILDSFHLIWWGDKILNEILYLCFKEKYNNKIISSKILFFIIKFFELFFIIFVFTFICYGIIIKN